MSIDNFRGDTFVAFCDISGFKQMMKNDQRAIEALDKFYSIGYRTLNQHQNENGTNVEGFFISDAGILFVRSENNDYLNQLKLLLKVIQDINRRLLNYKVMLTCSIAFGKFNYHGKIEFRGIEKNRIYGNAYVKAFLDNEKNRPKINAGQCRIVKEDLPNTILNQVGNYLPNIREKKNHFYYYWMVQNPNKIDDFESEYNDAYKRKYAGFLESLNKPWV